MHIHEISYQIIYDNVSARLSRDDVTSLTTVSTQASSEMDVAVFSALGAKQSLELLIHD